MTQPVVYLVRHGETAWSLSGQHTGRTDLPLTVRGERNARRLGERLKNRSFAKIYSSPLQRASRTCELAGFGVVAEIDGLALEPGEEGHEVTDGPDRPPVIQVGVAVDAQLRDVLLGVMHRLLVRRRLRLRLGRATPPTSCSACRWPSHPFSRTGSTATGRMPSRGSWGASVQPETVGSTIPVSSSGCAAKA